MATLEMLETWLSSREDEHLDFKEAKTQYDMNKLLRYCVAFANECGGYLILGVSDKSRKVVGTNAYPNVGEIKSHILNKLHFRVEIHELQHPDGRVLVFEVPSRPIGQPVSLDGVYLMRAGEELVPMSPDQLRRIILEKEADWFALPALSDVSPDQIIALLDTQIYFDLLKIPYPTTQEKVLERFEKDNLIKKKNGRWLITNLAAILLAKHLESFSPTFAGKAPRVIIYKGTDKLETHSDLIDMRGYAVGFSSLVETVHSAAPQNHFIEQVVREEVKMFPKQALRELIANALVHQDFSITGASVMIEMYTDRVEISNPGVPRIKVDRFIDENQSRNELLANMMRKLGICEVKGSGIDKVVKAAEVFQLPAPDFRTGDSRTVAILFSYQNFSNMQKKDRIRACYQHCCLLYVSNQRMSNQTVRERFKLPESGTATVSLVIGDTKEAGLIKSEDVDSKSSRYARYVPYWA